VETGWGVTATLIPEVLRQLEMQGYKGRIVPARRLRDMQAEIDAQVRQGLFDEEFYQERLALFTFDLPDSLPDARSLIVVAVPEPSMRITFTRHGNPLPITVPPTFFPERGINTQVQNLLAESLEPAGYRVALAVLPKKLLAVHSGLGVYGRNNLCYVPGMGSFHRLVALCSDLPCPENEWRELEMMESCHKCFACQRHCPTGAITAERFLLHAERCLTFHNERPNEIDFPSWIDGSWHNRVIGCFHCQAVCPQNRGFLEWVEEGAAFSEEETDLIMQGLPLDQLPSALAEKVARFDIVGLLEVLPRNLAVLLLLKGENPKPGAVQTTTATADP
jgi:epoxyqueuosine reductase